jgi:hypothetical protein
MSSLLDVDVSTWVAFRPVSDPKLPNGHRRRMTAKGRGTRSLVWKPAVQAEHRVNGSNQLRPRPLDLVGGTGRNGRPREDLNHCPIKERNIYKKGICQN